MINGGIVGGYYGSGGGGAITRAGIIAALGSQGLPVANVNGAVARAELSRTLDFFSTRTTKSPLTDTTSFQFLNAAKQLIAPTGDQDLSWSPEQVALFRFWRVNQRQMIKPPAGGHYEDGDFATALEAIRTAGDVVHMYALEPEGPETITQTMTITVAENGTRLTGPAGKDTFEFPITATMTGQLEGNAEVGNIFRFVGEPLTNLRIPARLIEDLATGLSGVAQPPYYDLFSVLQDGGALEPLEMARLAEHIKGVDTQNETIVSNIVHYLVTNTLPYTAFNLSGTNTIRIRITQTAADTKFKRLLRPGLKLKIGNARFTLGNTISVTDNHVQADYTLDSGAFPGLLSRANFEVQGELLHWSDLTTIIAAIVTRAAVYAQVDAIFPSTGTGALTVTKNASTNTVQLNVPSGD